MSKRARNRDPEVDDDERELKRLRADLDVEEARDAANKERMELIMDEIGFRYALPVSVMVAELQTRKSTWTDEFRAQFWRKLARMEMRPGFGPREPYRMVNYADALWGEWARAHPTNHKKEAQFREGIYVLFSRVVRLVLYIMERTNMFELSISRDAIKANVPTEPEHSWLGTPGSYDEWYVYPPQRVAVVMPNDHILEHNEQLFEPIDEPRVRTIFHGPGHYAPWPLLGFRQGTTATTGLTLVYHRQYHVMFNNWLIASGDDSRRRLMQRHMFRYIPDLPDGRIDSEHQGVFLVAGRVSSDAVPLNGLPDRRFDAQNQDRLIQFDAHPRPRALERIDDAGTGPDKFELPWHRNPHSVNLYRLEFKTRRDTLVFRSLTKPLAHYATSLTVHDRGINATPERMAVLSAPESELMAVHIPNSDVIYYVDRGRFKATMRARGSVGIPVITDDDAALFHLKESCAVLAGSIFSGTEYEAIRISVTAAFFVSSIHLDNLLDWMYRLATKLGISGMPGAPGLPWESHHRGLYSLKDLLDLTIDNLEINAQYELRMANRNQLRQLADDAVLTIPDFPPTLETLKSAEKLEILMDWALSSSHNGFITDLVENTAPDLSPGDITRQDVVDMMVRSIAKLGRGTSQRPRVHFCCVTCGAVTASVHHSCTACGFAGYCSHPCRTKAWLEGDHKLYCIRLDGRFSDARDDRKTLAYRAFEMRWGDAVRDQLGMASSTPLDLTHWNAWIQTVFQQAMAVITEGRVVLDAERLFLMHDSIQERDARARNESTEGVTYSLLRQLWIHLPDSEKQRYLPPDNDRKTRRSPEPDEVKGSPDKKRSKSSSPTRQRRDIQLFLNRIQMEQRVPAEIKALLARYTPATIVTLASHLKLLRGQRHYDAMPPAAVDSAMSTIDKVLKRLFQLEVQAPLAALVAQELIWVAHYPYTEFFVGRARTARLARMAEESQALEQLVARVAEETQGPVSTHGESKVRRIFGDKLWRLYVQRLSAAMVAGIGTHSHYEVRGDIFDVHSPSLVKTGDHPLALRTATNYAHASLLRETMSMLPDRDTATVILGFVSLFPRAVLSVYPDGAELAYLLSDEVFYEFGTMLGGGRTWSEAQLRPDADDPEPLQRRTVSEYAPENSIQPAEWV